MRFKAPIGICVAIAAILAGAPLFATEMKVTLLGTGTPTPRLSNFSASTLVEAGNQRLLFDLGRGVTIRLFQKKIPLGSISAHFLTHLHSDHVVGLPDIWLSGWVGTPWASRKTPFVLYGPSGTKAMADNLTKAFAEDLRIRAEDEHLPASGIAFATTDIAPGVVYEKDGVKVTAIEVNHGDKIKPAFGYVVEFDGKKVVLSGDTKYDERVINAARGADLLIHEVAVIEPELVRDYPSYREIEAHHTSPEDAGRVFDQAKPKLAVYSHIVFATVKPVQDIPEDALRTRTQTTYKGPYVIGADLMSFTINTNGVTAVRGDGSVVTPNRAP
jgi:ribonuclease Z